MKNLICAALTLTLLLCFTIANAATPSAKVEEVVQAYAEMYVFGSSKNFTITGIPQDLSDQIEKTVQSQLMTAFVNYPLQKDNFQTVKEKYFDKLQSIIKISARLKTADKINPVVELTVNNIDQAAADNLKNQEADLLTLDIMNHLGNTEELVSDGQYQNIAVESIGHIINGLTATPEKTFDVTCEIVSDEGKSYWKPIDIQTLASSVMIDFVIKEADPQVIEEMLALIFTGEKSDKSVVVESDGADNQHD